MNYSIEPITDREKALLIIAHLDGQMREVDVRLLGYECAEEVFYLHESEYLPEPGHLDARVHTTLGEELLDGFSRYRVFIESLKSKLTWLARAHEGHTATCYAELKGQLVERCRWRKEHPYHCRSCQGYGVLSEAESYDTPGFTGPCACVEDGICPICGSGTLNDDGDFCSTCQWAYDITPGEPRISECDGDYCTYIEEVRRRNETA